MTGILFLQPINRLPLFRRRKQTDSGEKRCCGFLCDNAENESISVITSPLQGRNTQSTNRRFVRRVYFDYPNTTPKITVKRGEEKLPVEDPVFFEKLVNSIDGKPIPETVPFYPEYIYLVEIGKYDFALHEGHIIIYSPLGRNIKGQEIIEVECTKEEISELVELLDAAK